MPPRRPLRAVRSGAVPLVLALALSLGACASGTSPDPGSEMSGGDGSGRRSAQAVVATPSAPQLVEGGESGPESAPAPGGTSAPGVRAGPGGRAHGSAQGRQPGGSSGGSSPLAALVRPAGRTDRLATASRTEPTELRFDAVRVPSAPVVPVGVEPGGAMEIPGPGEVGWYRYGPVPGEPGSAVLAAHVAFDGRSGVFRHLADSEVGDQVTVVDGDGTVRRFEVTSVTRHAKVDLGSTDVFRRDGPATLVLITCGGAFDPERRSYRDNVVVRAEPAGP